MASIRYFCFLSSAQKCRLWRLPREIAYSTCFRVGHQEYHPSSVKELASRSSIGCLNSHHFFPPVGNLDHRNQHWLSLVSWIYFSTTIHHFHLHHSPLAGSGPPPLVASWLNHWFEWLLILELLILSWAGSLLHLLLVLGSLWGCDPLGFWWWLSLLLLNSFLSHSWYCLRWRLACCRAGLSFQVFLRSSALRWHDSRRFVNHIFVKFLLSHLCIFSRPAREEVVVDSRRWPAEIWTSHLSCCFISIRPFSEALAISLKEAVVERWWHYLQICWWQPLPTLNPEFFRVFSLLFSAQLCWRHPQPPSRATFWSWLHLAYFLRDLHPHYQSHFPLELCQPDPISTSSTRNALRSVSFSNLNWSLSASN